MALVHAELYLALRSANVPHELAQAASLVDFSSHDRTWTRRDTNHRLRNFDPAMAKLEAEIGCIEVMLFVNFLLSLTILVFT